MNRKFYRTTITIEFLSEAAPADLDIDEVINEAIGEDRIVHDVKSEDVAELDAAAMAKALNDARSYAGFFDLEEHEED